MSGAVGWGAHKHAALIRQIDIGKLRIVEMEREEGERSGNGAEEDALAAEQQGNGEA